MNSKSIGGKIIVTVNGTDHQLPSGSTAHDLVASLGLEGRPVAVELNEHVVPRVELPGRVLHQDDRLEIVTLVGGG
ncbi:MAG: sulfur carrier protein ThiS [Oleiphilaceae bacterium]|nr:sulfur carrier protein ThiS [Oleiphilaceae bacterium]